MSLIYTPETVTTTRRRRSLPRSPKWGADWRRSVRGLRIAVEDTVGNAHWGCPRFTPDRVGLTIIDHIRELDSTTLPVLQVVFAELVRQSRR